MKERCESCGQPETGTIAMLAHFAAISAQKLVHAGYRDESILCRECIELELVRIRKSSKPRTIGFIGRVTWDKGPHTLIQALSLCNPTVRVIIIGQGVAVPRLKRLARLLHIEDRVDFSGQVPHEKVAALRGSCDVICVPSYVLDSLPRAYTECGISTPVIISDRCGTIPLLPPNAIVPCFDIHGWAQAIHEVLGLGPVSVSPEKIRLLKCSNAYLLGGWLQRFLFGSILVGCIPSHDNFRERANAAPQSIPSSAW